ncbi:MAG: hypothetical protein F2788_00595 [Actinobacteria bacterium]|nr:hypothetical protein [Actinomycetota bacterium]MUH52996.1 hypothetical protein [Actinomycetota bacterium]
MQHERSRMMRRSIVTTMATAVLVLTTLAGCASSVPTESMSVLDGSEILTADLGNDVTARGVVLAAVLLVAGDVEKAVTKGLVTPPEVQAARKAIDEGTLDIWRQRADADEATP